MMIETDGVAAKRGITNGLQPVAQAFSGARLVSFAVTTDSVVATAELIADASHELVAIHWGDGHITAIDLRKARLTQVEAGNKLRVQHVYEETDILSKMLVYAITRDKQGRNSIDATSVSVRPRYKLIYYPTRIEINSHTDLGSNSEFEVSAYFMQGIANVKSNAWRLVVQTGNIITTGNPTIIPLTESNFTLEMEATDEPIRRYFHATEDDGAWDYVESFLNSFGNGLGVKHDTSQYLPLYLHPNEFTGTLTQSIAFPVDGGKITAHFSMEMNLIVPFDRQTGVEIARI